MFYRAHGAYASSSKRAWQQMFKWIDENRLRQKITAGFGLLHDNPRLVAVDHCRYDACISVPEGLEGRIPEMFSLQKLPGGAYARQRHDGLTGDLSLTIAKLRDDNIPKNGLWIDPHRPMLEIYHDDPELTFDGERKIDVCIPVTVTEQKPTIRSAA